MEHFGKKCVSASHGGENAYGYMGRSGPMFKIGVYILNTSPIPWSRFQQSWDKFMVVYSTINWNINWAFQIACLWKFSTKWVGFDVDMLSESSFKQYTNNAFTSQYKLSGHKFFRARVVTAHNAITTVPLFACVIAFEDPAWFVFPYTANESVLISLTYRQTNNLWWLQ